MKRTLSLEAKQQTGQEITLKGWVNTIREHGGVNFIDLRDRSGIIQVVGGKELKAYHPEDVIQVTGTVVERSPENKNPNIPTGEVEVKSTSSQLISQAKTPPFPLDVDGHKIDEDLRLKYRYLDLRRPRMSQNIKLRFQAAQFIRQYLQDKDFTEIETPILTKTTPEGARDFIVPSRLQPGNFYALPQSPQQYKQLLMVAGFERYFQFARCFRDEDPRADRAYGEFTQLDMEMSFVTQEDILSLTEDMFTSLVKAIFPEKTITQSPWPRISHQESMEKYQSDKPDLRQDKNNPHELAFAWVIDFPLFTEQSEEDFFHGSGQAQYAPSHHMFTAPHPDDIALLDSDPQKVRGLQHDLALNGYEVGGGSIRIHQPDIQAKVFDLIGFTDEQKSQFNHMLTAFEYGVPPHGGIAPGLDRFLMAALSESSVRELIAFPNTSSGRTSVMNAPSPAAKKQLAELDLLKPDKKYQSVYEHIIDTLKSRSIKYQEYEHEPVFTSEQAKDVRGDVSLSQGAKALLLRVKKEHLLLIIPGDQKADLKAVRKHLGTSQAKLESIDKIKAITGVEAGAVPPLGSVMGLKTLVDNRLGQNQEIVFNAGRHDRSIKISYQDYINLEKPDILKNPSD